MKRLLPLLIVLAGCGTTAPRPEVVVPSQRSAGRTMMEVVWATYTPSEVADICAEVDSLGVDVAAAMIVDGMGRQSGEFTVSRSDVADFLTDSCS